MLCGLVLSVATLEYSGNQTLRVSFHNHSRATLCVSKLDILASYNRVVKTSGEFNCGFIKYGSIHSNSVSCTKRVFPAPGSSEILASAIQFFAIPRSEVCTVNSDLPRPERRPSACTELFGLARAVSWDDEGMNSADGRDPLSTWALNSSIALIRDGNPLSFAGSLAP